MSESHEPQSKSPEDIEDFRIELPDVYKGKLSKGVKDQYDDSYGRGWKLAVGGAAIIITLAGSEYFRRKHGEEE